ncbi:unnamed protein product [Candidula unifasciata]|uniref:Sepiapterin reductase n=1 Tax=Candidula unifasciata TaxID=100452 RepID=A0A8S4A1E0_9EUPU|nr:unnamed protein product [Candidula unifasciata]
MADSILQKKSVCVVTGPTRGLGRSIAYQLSKKLPDGSLFILLSKNKALLDEIAGLIITHRDEIRVVTSVFDQGSSDQGQFDNVFQDCLVKAGAHVNEFEQAILVNNAGTLELLELSRDLDNVNAVNVFFSTNITGCVVLTAKFLQVFSATAMKARVIINISSLAAVSPMKSWLLYCMAKSSRDMMMKVIGEEEDNIRTLNYAPGPLATDMSVIASTETKDPSLRAWFEDQVKNKTLVECDQSVEKLITVLEKNSFANGAHIDYYDEA